MCTRRVPKSSCRCTYREPKEWMRDHSTPVIELVQLQLPPRYWLKLTLVEIPILVSYFHDPVTLLVFLYTFNSFSAYLFACSMVFHSFFP